MLRDWIRARNSSGDPEEFRLSLVEHLDELRIRLIRSLVAIVISATIAWFAVDPLYAAMTEHIRTLLPKGLEYQEVFRSITEPFFLKVKLSIYFGMILALPISVSQLWGFIKPGLRPHEQRPFRMIGPLSIFLFLLGCYFCWLILPPTINWFGEFVQGSFKDTAVLQEAGTLIFFVLNMMLGFGLGFQLPLVVFFLAHIGLLPPEALNKYWRQAMVVIFIVSALITPSPDPISMLMMALPLTGLFVISVYAVKLSKKRALPPEAAGPEELLD